MIYNEHLPVINNSVVTNNTLKPRHSSRKRGKAIREHHDEDILKVSKPAKNKKGPLIVAVVKDGVEYPISADDQQMISRQILIESGQHNSHLIRS